MKCDSLAKCQRVFYSTIFIKYLIYHWNSRTNPLNSRAILMIGFLTMEELELKARIVRGTDGSVDFYFAKDYDNAKHFDVIKSYLDNAKEAQLQQMREQTVQMDEYMKRANEQYAEFMKTQTEQMKIKMSNEIIY